MVKDIDKILKGSDKGESFVVHLDDDKKASAEKLKAFAKDNELTRTALTTHKDGKASPAGHKIADSVKFTVIVYEKKKVVENFALDKLDEASRKKIVQSLQKLIATPAEETKT